MTTGGGCLAALPPSQRGDRHRRLNRLREQNGNEHNNNNNTNTTNNSSNFNNLHVILSLEAKQIHTCAADKSSMVCVVLKRGLLK